ncbi:pentapeptide repeat-containing protein [Chitinophaga sp. G-6-1-13]|uniref:Pentapeptide repeat-containing protein n=1 Tax=Chitinophaga fulva TaxID=2728842 RepID=A0A848GIT6_9BACT|nr:pentapeptide repeat-containing protein [Chitinophaga fulva]NML36630.1 pentapeptide repeat-containing protein [Chitinophaga fulva]
MSKSNGSIIHQQKTFSDVNYAGRRLENREFVQCEFIDCDFSKSDLRDNSFEDCHFKQCNFSMVILNGAGFRDARFTGCKMLGVDFTQCNRFMFSFSFYECILDYSTFLGTRLRKTLFHDCSLKEVDFSEADLTSADFKNSDLTMARFSNTILEKADFRNAQNFGIDPDFNKMKKARFSALNLSGLLYKYNLDIE